MQHHNLIGDTIRSLGFLSRIPLPSGYFSQNDSLITSARAFPIAGAILGALAGLILILADQIHLPPLTCAFIAVGALAALTGALHEDGLGDTADGFFGGSNAERRLEIMKDSRIGTFAALSLIISVGIKVSLLSTIIEQAGAWAAALALIGAEALSRSALLSLWYALPSARPGGVADNAGQPQWETLICALLIGVFILAITLIPAAGLKAFTVALISSIVLLVGFVRLCRAKIGGQTGDTLGATQQITVIAVLAGLVSSF